MPTLSLAALRFAAVALALTPSISVAEIHGPICSWHDDDPTSSMTVQWIEKVNADMEENKWFEDTAGFGDSDNDDETMLLMLDKHQVLHIRKTFKAESLPRIGHDTFMGHWQAVAELPDGGGTRESRLRFFQTRDGVTAEVEVDGKTIKIDKVEIKDKVATFHFPFEAEGLTGTVHIEITRDDKAENFEGKYTFKDAQDAELATGKFTGTRPPQPEKHPLVGGWKVAITLPDGKVEQLPAVITKEGDGFKGVFPENDNRTLQGIELKADKQFSGTFDYETSGLKGIVHLKAELKDDRLAGDWSFSVNSNEVAKGKWEASKNVEDDDTILAPFDLEKIRLSLNIYYDDAFIAYLNGKEVLRSGVVDQEDGTRTIQGHEAEWETFDIDDKFLDLLVEGDQNVLAIEGWNLSINSPDFSLHPELQFRVGDEKDPRTVIGKNETWQFLLGKPQEDWTTASIKVEELVQPPKNLTPFSIRYARRGSDDWSTIKAEPRPFADTGHVIHMSKITGLKPDTAYQFVINSEIPYSSPQVGTSFFFRTAPDKVSADGVAFVTGGDMFHKRNLLDAMNHQAGMQNPVFALLGGDLAYANGKDSWRWCDWVDSWHNEAVTQGDNLVPMVVAIGNQECNGEIKDEPADKVKDYKPTEHAKFYYSLFVGAQKRKSSDYVIDFGDYMSIVLLDSNHTQTPESQKAWLEETLRERQSRPNLFTCHHRPTYGTLVKEDEKDVREHWVPLFEKYGVDVAFENDHHVYKRTLPIKEDKIDYTNGVVYMGDGAWGVDVRNIDWKEMQKREYLHRGENLNHLIKVTVKPGLQLYEAFLSDGRRFDSYPRLIAK
ncbi:MAG: metallophosphoesterase family protein [Verrucomicrobia bacterium]|nr:metallophosphoesterase family protein [Verrucomicrobiota bacterium]